MREIVEKPISARATDFEKSGVAGFNRPAKLSIVIPCYIEEKTLEECVDRVVAIADDTLNLEIIIVDDCSKDRSREDFFQKPKATCPLSGSRSISNSNGPVLTSALFRAKAALKAGVEGI